jgi:hypothetical protein
MAGQTTSFQQCVVSHKTMSPTFFCANALTERERENPALDVLHDLEQWCEPRPASILPRSLPAKGAKSADDTLLQYVIYHRYMVWIRLRGLLLARSVSQWVCVRLLFLSLSTCEMFALILITSGFVNITTQCMHSSSSSSSGLLEAPIDLAPLVNFNNRLDLDFIQWLCRSATMGAFTAEWQ